VSINQLKAQIFGSSAPDDLIHGSIFSGIVLVVTLFSIVFLTYGQHRAAGAYKISSIVEGESGYHNP
jgi:hypothetical protein